jgi:hypothetical protein
MLPFPSPHLVYARLNVPHSAVHAEDLDTEYIQSSGIRVPKGS